MPEVFRRVASVEYISSPENPNHWYPGKYLEGRQEPKQPIPHTAEVPNTPEVLERQISTRQLFGELSPERQARLDLLLNLVQLSGD